MKSAKPSEKTAAPKAGGRSGNKSGPSEKKFSKVFQYVTKEGDDLLAKREALLKPGYSGHF